MPAVIVGTPGRVLQLLREHVAAFSGVTQLLLLGAHRLLDQADMRGDVAKVREAKQFTRAKEATRAVP